jgi:hypothetical protein
MKKNPRQRAWMKTKNIYNAKVVMAPVIIPILFAHAFVCRVARARKITSATSTGDACLLPNARSNNNHNHNRKPSKSYYQRASVKTKNSDHAENVTARATSRTPSAREVSEFVAQVARAKKVTSEMLMVNACHSVNVRHQKLPRL